MHIVVILHDAEYRLLPFADRILVSQCEDTQVDLRTFVIHQLLGIDG